MPSRSSKGLPGRPFFPGVVCFLFFFLRFSFPSLLKPWITLKALFFVSRYVTSLSFPEGRSSNFPIYPCNSDARCPPSSPFEQMVVSLHGADFLVADTKLIFPSHFFLLPSLLLGSSWLPAKPPDTDGVSPLAFFFCTFVHPRSFFCPCPSGICVGSILEGSSPSPSLFSHFRFSTHHI